MKHSIFIIAVLLLFSCGSGNVSKLNPAAKEVAAKIKTVQQQQERFKKNQTADFSEVNAIVNLSGIIPEKYSTDYFGIHYMPSEQNISDWGVWFEKNKALFSYYDNEDIKKIYKEKLIKIEYEPNKYRYSISEIELENLREQASKKN